MFPRGDSGRIRHPGSPETKRGSFLHGPARTGGTREVHPLHRGRAGSRRRYAGVRARAAQSLPLQRGVPGFGRVDRQGVAASPARHQGAAQSE